MKSFACEILVLLLIAPSSNAAEVGTLIKAALIDGIASDFVDGDVAKVFSQSLNANGSLNATATLKHRYQQRNCGRVRVDYIQQNALPTGYIRPITIKFWQEIDICEDGSAPTMRSILRGTTK